MPLTKELRQTTQKMADEMHAYFARGYTPKSKPGTHCNACSLKELCLPVLYQRADPKAYLRAHLDEMQEPRHEKVFKHALRPQQGRLPFLEGENIVLLCNKAEIGRVPLHTLEGIVCFSYPGASPALMGKCASLGVDLSFFSPQGRFLARAVGEERGNVLLRQTQYRIADSEAESCLYARNFILGKVYNARWVLERATRDHPQRVPVEQLKRTSAQLAAALPSSSSVTTSTSFAVWRARRHSGISTALIHSSCSSTMIFLSPAGAAARRWTIPMPCSLSLIRFWPPTARRLFRVWASTPTSLSPPRRPGPQEPPPSTSWKSCVQFMPTASCSPASTRKS